MAVELARRKDERLDLQLDRIEREGERLDALVGNTLALAKMGALPELTDMLDLAEVVDAVVEDARFEAGDRNVGIAWERPAPRIQGDRESLASAIENVLRNALRFAPTGSSIRLRLLAGLRDVQLEIEDRGPGVPEQELGYLFEPFYRSASGAAMAGSGAGLGLSIARAAVAAHKGRISASNVLPQGLSMRIELPLAAT
ncbi:ATP-binding protein [Achromobacter xylosoxidans]